MASLLVFIGTFGEIIAYFIFVTVAFIGLTVLGLFRVRRREREAGRGKGEAGSGKREANDVYRTPGYPVTPLVFLVLVAMLLILLAANNPLQAALGTAVVALGWPVYHLWVRKQ